MTEAQIIKTLLDFIASDSASDEQFNALALKIFDYQFQNNRPYQLFCRQREQTPRTTKNWRDIPCIGILTSNCVSHDLLTKADWDIPDGILQKNICNESCCLATDWCESYNEYFLEDNMPLEKCEEFSNPLFRFK